MGKVTNINLEVVNSKWRDSTGAWPRPEGVKRIGMRSQPFVGLTRVAVDRRKVAVLRPFSYFAAKNGHCV
jgi:hypothetical protein